MYNVARNVGTMLAQCFASIPNLHKYWDNTESRPEIEEKK